MSDKLSELKISEFVELLASHAPAPGGGSASALAGSIGVALTAMVAALTLGKEKYKEYEVLTLEVAEKTCDLKAKMLDAMNRDTEAFNGVSAVFSMPKNTDEEKLARKEAMQNALKAATVVPFEIMVFAAEAIEVTDRAVGKSNASAASDLGVAALNLKSAIQGAWLNVLINLGSIKDEEFVSKYTALGQDILKKSIPLADSIYERVLEMM